MVLGMEETVHYEHLRNEALGFEMDYDYESFRRYTDAERERFVSTWDDPGNIEDYMDVTRSAEDAETVAAALTEELSRDFELTRVTRKLERAGSCIRIEASVIKGTNQMTDQLVDMFDLSLQIFVTRDGQLYEQRVLSHPACLHLHPADPFDRRDDHRVLQSDARLL